MERTMHHVLTAFVVVALCCLAPTSDLSAQDAEFFFDRGAASYDKGEYEQGIADFSQALRRVGPQDAGLQAMIYTSRGLAWNDKGEAEKALADHTQALRLDPNYAEAYANRGLT